MHDLTQRQREIYDYLRRVAPTSSYPMSLDALCAALKLRSRGSLHKHIQALIKAGLVAPMDKKQRGIRLRPAALHQNNIGASGLPLLGSIAAGRPIEAVTEAESVEVPVNLRTRRPCYVLRVKGDSMVDENIIDGDQIVIEQRDEARNGEIVVALIDGQDATLKRIEQRPGKIVLHPANACYKPMEFAPERVTIQGVVVGLIRSYR